VDPTTVHLPEGKGLVVVGCNQSTDFNTDLH